MDTPEDCNLYWTPETISVSFKPPDTPGFDNEVLTSLPS